MNFIRTLMKERKHRTNVFIGALLLGSLFFAGVGMSDKGFSSVEVAFTDASHSGLAIVPASCPSDPHFVGDCSGPVTCPNGDPAPNGSTLLCTCAQGNVLACQPPWCTLLGIKCLPPGCGAGTLNDTCARCPDGSAAPNNNTAQCTCAQGNTAACVNTCPNGDPAPNNTVSQCTCAQGNVAACTCPAGQHSVSAICICDSTNLPPVNGQCTAQVCPSGFVWDPGSGQCIEINSCTLPPICSDSTHVLNQCTGAVTNCASNGPGWTCQNAVCIKPPPPIASIISSPKLVQSGTVVTISWSSQNTASCTVTGNNGDGSWSGTSGSHASSPIQAQTIYTLTCLGLDGSTIVKAATINIIPVETEN